jgi:hypothetical protein
MIGWILFADALAHVAKQHEIDNREAARQIITAARQGALYTQGRLYHSKGRPFAISPAAWDGMDPYPALSTLCTPNPGLEIQDAFLGSPNGRDVEIHVGSLDAYVAGKPRPPAPIMQPVPDALRKSPLVWLELHPQPTGDGNETVTPLSPSPVSATGETAKAEGQVPELRPRGKPATVGPAIVDKMRKMDRAKLAAMKEEEMAETFGASRSTTRDIRNKVLAENGGK